MAWQDWDTQLLMQDIKSGTINLERKSNIVVQQLIDNPFICQLRDLEFEVSFICNLTPLKLGKTIFEWLIPFSESSDVIFIESKLGAIRQLIFQEEGKKNSWFRS